MDSKIKFKVESLKWTGIAFCAMLLILLSACNTNNWADWKAQNEAWLENNKMQENVEVTSSGLQYKVIADPTKQDAKPKETSTIICDYRVRLINGYIVDAGNYVQLTLSNTIPGFAEGCYHIHNNGDIEIYIPAYLGYDNSKYKSNEYNMAEGYGTEGTQSYIPPYSTLIYEVHICAVSD